MATAAEGRWGEYHTRVNKHTQKGQRRIHGRSQSAAYHSTKYRTLVASLGATKMVQEQTKIPGADNNYLRVPFPGQIKVDQSLSM